MPDAQHQYLAAYCALVLLAVLRREQQAAATVAAIALTVAYPSLELAAWVLATVAVGLLVAFFRSAS